MPDFISVSVTSNEEDVGSEGGDKPDDWFSDVGENLSTLSGDGYETDELTRVDSQGSLFVDVDLELVGEGFSDSAWVVTHCEYICTHC